MVHVNGTELAHLPDHTPEIMMSLSQRLHVLVDLSCGANHKIADDQIRGTGQPGNTSPVRLANW